MSKLCVGFVISIFLYRVTCVNAPSIFAKLSVVKWSPLIEIFAQNEEIQPKNSTVYQKEDGQLVVMIDLTQVEVDTFQSNDLAFFSNRMSPVLVDEYVLQNLRLYLVLDAEYAGKTLFVQSGSLPVAVTFVVAEPFVMQEEK